MDFVSGIVVYILLWWWSFLMSLPFGLKVPDEVKSGHASSAPANPFIKQKLIAATVISSVLFVIVYFVIESGLISFENL